MRLVVLTSILAAGIIGACGSNDQSTFGNGSGNGDGGTGNSDGSAFDFEGGDQADADLYKNDPPPQWCGADGGPAAPPQPGGTLQCPDDKNLENCPCKQAGQTAACWPGLRANRDLGICKDGTTTCKQIGENVLVWGPCQGAVLPQQGATKGAPACKCFSKGTWKLSNLEPCFWTFNGDQSKQYSVATVMGADGGTPTCPTGEPNQPPLKVGDPLWSHDTLNVDCAGHFKLCYTIKAGDIANPQASDCQMFNPVCVESDYITANVDQVFPDLASWVGANDPTCATQFANTGGYGEMTVIGLSVRCDKVDDGAGNPYVFNRVKYCPVACNQNPNGPGCTGCGAGGSGQF